MQEVALSEKHGLYVHSKVSPNTAGVDAGLQLLRGYVRQLRLSRCPSVLLHRIKRVWKSFLLFLEV